MTESPPVEQNPPWWKERMVWMIIALPLSAVVAGITTVFIAANNADDLVKTAYIKNGMAVDAPKEAHEAAARMGLSGALSFAHGILRVHVDKLPPSTDVITLTLVHPGRAELDQQISLTAVGQGIYQAQATLTGQGKRQLILEPPDHSWRLEGEWHAPFSEETSLHPGA